MPSAFEVVDPHAFRLSSVSVFARLRQRFSTGMLAKVNSAALYGIDALRVEVEIDLASGLPQLATVVCLKVPSKRAKIESGRR